MKYLDIPTKATASDVGLEATLASVLALTALDTGSAILGIVIGALAAGAEGLDAIVIVCQVLGGLLDLVDDALSLRTGLTINDWLIVVVLTIDALESEENRINHCVCDVIPGVVQVHGLDIEVVR